MEKRRCRRYPVALNATVVADGESYEGIIGNVSQEGLGYTITTMIESEKDIGPRQMLGLRFMIPTGELIELACEIRWYIRPAPGRRSSVAGLKIIEPSPRYLEWIKRIEEQDPE